MAMTNNILSTFRSILLAPMTLVIFMFVFFISFFEALFTSKNFVISLIENAMYVSDIRNSHINQNLGIYAWYYVFSAIMWFCIYVTFIQQ